MEQYYENYVIIDISANLVSRKFSRDLDEVIQRAKDAGVQKIMINGTSVKSSKEALRLTRIYPGCVYSTAGMHPHDAHTFNEESWLEMCQVASSVECVAIGVCGLDYSKEFSTPLEQKTIFQKHIKLSIELKKPLLIHEKGAHQDLLAVLDASHPSSLSTVIVRNFTGTVEQAKEYLKRGYYLGINGYVCKDKSDCGVRQLLIDGIVPLDRLLVETDAPFTYPNLRASKMPAYIKSAITKRSVTCLNRYCTFQRNEPCSLPAIVEIIAAFMQKQPGEVAVVTAFNAMKLFGLS